ncbi:hypothetical protein GPJ56_000137 [Histomonas meleagridis]|uniref:uncharacterized protein n=1 Tax=Histomonas meleagridis TaxID=135588 RepID=UPI003559AC3B|nr:hypothetical protein GPJ56_000137 [Histomonas meleagridis]KAH0805636.1 hypothetical protein GO595_001691 [Histomonas meleagridis]
MPLEQTPYVYLSFIIVSLVTIKYSKIAFDSFPKEIPRFGKFIIESEYSFISSILTGVNTHREQFWKLRDPNLVNATFSFSQSIPLYYCASLMECGANYSEVSLLISFINSLCTTSAIFFFCRFFAPNLQFWVVMCYFFGGSWALFKLLNPQYSSNTDLDFVHQCGIGGQTPHYQTFSFHFIISKVSSFVIPICIFAMTCIQGSQRPFVKSLPSYYILVGLLATLIPSTATSICFFIFASNYKHAILYVLPFALSLIPKVISERFSYFPVWREYQMQGIFFAHFVTFLDSYGLPYLFMFFFPFAISSNNNDVYEHRVLTGLVVFVIMCFMREGISLFANDLVVSSIFLPMIMMNFIIILNNIKNSKRKMKGFGLLIFIICFGICIISGCISINRIFREKVKETDVNAINIGNWIIDNIPNDETILTNSIDNPVSFISGYQTLVSNYDNMFLKGYNIFISTKILDIIKKFNNGAEIMNELNMTYLVENVQNPIVIANMTQRKYFDVLNQNGEWQVLMLKKDMFPKKNVQNEMEY